MSDEHDYTALDVRCAAWPTEKQTRKARRFGEGFTWTCPDCAGRDKFHVLTLIQGKGKHYFWHTTPTPRRGAA